MSFKLTSVVYCDDVTHDVLADFQTKREQWHRSTSRTFRNSRRKKIEKFCPNQVEQPIVTKVEISPPSVMGEFITSSYVSNQTSKSKQTENAVSVPHFTIVDERPVQYHEIAQGLQYIGTQVKRTQQKGNSFIVFNNWCKTAIPNDRRLRMESENPYNQQLNPRKQQNIPFPSVNSNSLAQKLQQNMPLPNVNSNPALQNLHQNRLIPRKCDTFFYRNQVCNNGQWSLIWDIDKLENIPLILDRNDKYILFTDKINSDIGEKGTLKQWDSLDLLPQKNYYLQLMTKKVKKIDIQHSNAALSLALIQPNIDDPENFHRPKFFQKNKINNQLRINKEYKLTRIMHDYKIQSGDSDNISPYLKDIEDLSAKNGIVYVIEHTSESPPLILNVGMASSMLTYWHKENPNDVPSFYDKTTVILEPDDESPFTAQIPNNQPIKAISCSLYRVPVFQHELRQNDFLLVFDAENNNQFYIRKIDGLFCAGMLEPLQCVMQPGLKSTQKFIENFTKAMLINIFRGTGKCKGRRTFILAKIQQEFFPDMNETKLRKIIQDYATFSREQTRKSWEVKQEYTQQVLDQSFSSLNVTPEKVCSYQSMVVGLWKLKKNGVSILTSSQRLYQKIKKLKGNITQKIAEKIEIELMKTPWAKTLNFHGAFRSNAMETINADDGQQVYRKKSRRSKVDQNSQVQKKKIAQTKADLRSLSLNELHDMLSDHNIPNSTIKNKSRWGLVNMVRSLANKQKDGDVNNDFVANYSRGPRNDYQASLEKYKAQYQSTFDTNLLYIQTVAKDENEGNINDNLLDELDLEIFHGNDDDDDQDIVLDLDITKEEKESTSTTTKTSSKGDPKELRPYGLYTYPTKIDWDKLGFAGYPRRKIAKIIQLSFNENGLELSLNWERRIDKINELKEKKSNVYLAESPLDFREDVYKKRKSKLQKIKKWKSNTKTPKSKMQNKFIKFEHYFTDELLISENKNSGQYCFMFTPSMKRQISKAVERFQEFESSSAIVKSKNKVQSSDNEDFDSDFKKKKIKKEIQLDTIVKFNHYLSKYLKIFEQKYSSIEQYQTINSKITASKYSAANDFFKDMDELITQINLSDDNSIDKDKCINKYNKNIKKHGKRFKKFESAILSNNEI